MVCAHAGRAKGEVRSHTDTHTHSQTQDAGLTADKARLLEFLRGLGINALSDLNFIKEEVRSYVDYHVDNVMT